jgi:photosystem II stability/assembly factor-like uncharacterized protein
MKIKLLSLSFILLFNLISASNFFSQTCWEPTNGPYGGQCNKLKTINNEVYAATNCGVYSTNDLGVTWKNKSGGILGECQIINDIDIVNNTMIIGTEDSGIYISNDFGNNWVTSNNGLVDPIGGFYRIYDVYVDGSNLLIGTSNGVYKSSNQGNSWTPSNIGISEPNNVNAYRFVKNGSSIFLATFNDIYKSNDNGFTWVNLNISFEIMSASFVSHAGALYVIDNGTSEIYKSVNNGQSWTILSFDFAFFPFRLYSVGSYLYCVASYGTTYVSYVSLDGGDSWTNFADKMFFDMIEQNNQVIGSGGGVCKWQNGTQDIYNAGLGGASSTNCLFRDDNTIYSGNANGIYKTNDDGNTWENISTGLPLGVVVNSIAKSGNNLIIGTKGFGIFLSTDNGGTWISSNNGLTVNNIYFSNVSTLFSYNGRVFMGAKENLTFFNNGALFISDNNGLSWTKSSDGLPQNFNVTSICNYNQYIIIGGGSHGVFLSVDNGANWLFDGLNASIKSLCSNSTGYYAASGNTVYKTDDLGNTWTSHTFNNGSGINSITIINNVIYTVQDNELHYLNNGNWTSFDSGCLGLNRKCLISNSSGELFIGASASNEDGYFVLNNGVSKYNGAISDVNEKDINTEITVYPNPTSHSITIKGETNMNQNFKIYDQMGREVFKGKLTGKDTEVNFSALSKGIYTLKIEGNYQPVKIVKE